MKRQYSFRLKTKERDHLREIIKKGTEKARKITRARILLLSEQNYTQQRVAETLSVSRVTVWYVCLRYLKGGLDNALNEKARSGRPDVFDGRQKAKITALACSQAPEGRSRWSLRLLADKAVELKLVDSISHMDVARILKKMK
jgi:putative transposase